MTGKLELLNGHIFWIKKYNPEKTKRCSLLRFGTVVHWTIDQKPDVAIFDAYLGSRMMRLTMFDVGENHQSCTLLTS